MGQVEEKVLLIVVSLFVNVGGLGIATVGFKLDTVFATIRTALESTGRLATVLEEKITPNLSFQVRAFV